MPPVFNFSKNVTGRGGSTDESAGAELNVEYEVECDTADVDAGDVIYAASVILGIAKGAAHPTRTWMFCTRVDADSIPKDPFGWTLRANYKEPAPVPGQEIDPGGGAAGQPSPEDRDPWITGSFRRDEFYRTTDLDGEPFLNSAGDKLENIPPSYETIGILTVTRWYASISYTGLKAYENQCNSGVWQGFAIHSLLCVGVAFEPKTERGWLGWKVTFNLEHRVAYPEQFECPAWVPAVTGGWIPTPILDQGYYSTVSDGIGGYNRVPAPAPYGEQSAVPILLDGLTGQPSATPKYIGRKMHGEISFAILDP